MSKKLIEVRGKNSKNSSKILVFKEIKEERDEFFEEYFGTPEERDRRNTSRYDSLLRR